VAGVINRQGVFRELKNIRVPTLIVVGDQDVATKPEKAHKLHQHITGSELVIIPGAGHTSSVEEPEAVNQAIRNFLEKR